MEKTAPKSEAEKVANLIVNGSEKPRHNLAEEFEKKGFKGSRVVNFEDDDLENGEIEILFRGGKYMPLPVSKDPEKAKDHWAKIEYVGGGMLCKAVMGLNIVAKTQLIRVIATMARDGLRIEEVIEVIDSKGRHRLAPPSQGKPQ